MYSTALILVVFLQCLKSDLEKVSVEKVTVSLMTQLFAFLLSTAHCGSKF